MHTQGDTEVIKRQQNTTINFFKFFYSIIIIVLHSANFYTYGNGYWICGWGGLSVEFFFFVSGYLMCQKAMNVEKSELQTPGEIGQKTFDFMIHKIRGIFSYILPAWVFAVLLNVLLRHYSGAELSNYLFDATPDLTMTAMAGFSCNSPIGDMWYISAMMIALAIFFPLVMRYRENVTMVGAPLLALLLYGWFSYYTGGMLSPGTYIEELMGFKGLFRGIAGIGLGNFAYSLAERLRRKKITQKEMKLLSVVEWAGYLLSTALFFLKEMPVNLDFLIVMMLLMAVTISFSGKSMLTQKFSRMDIPFFRKASLSLYLAHFPFSILLGEGYLVSGNDIRKKFIVYALCSVGQAVLIYISAAGIRKLCRVRRK